MAVAGEGDISVALEQSSGGCCVSSTTEVDAGPQKLYHKECISAKVAHKTL